MPHVLVAGRPARRRDAVALLAVQGPLITKENAGDYDFAASPY